MTVALEEGLPLVDTSKPCRDAARRTDSRHVVARRLAVGEHVRLFCWCAPKRCHLEAVAVVIRALATGYAALPAAHAPSQPPP